MPDADRHRLLHGPYQAPPLQRGDRATCLFRDADVIITSWTDALILWPRCRLPNTGGGSGLLVDAELARAVRTESAAAIMHWWGVSSKAIWHWRKALGVERAGTEGSRRLIQAAAEAGAAVLRGQALPPEQVERRRQRAEALNLAQHLQTGYHGPWWSTEELALLGKQPDEDIASRIGRTARAVRIMRTRLGIPNARDRRRRGNKP
jgi:hypothetical protein